MRHEDVYKGHHFVVETWKRGTGYAWSYRIGADKYLEMKDRVLPSEQMMLDEGIREAKAAIDRMSGP